MKLRRLRIDRLAGIPHGFEIRDLDPGLNVVLGPNASGKSSLLRAIRALLYGEQVSGPVSLEAEFEDGRGAIRVSRQGNDVRWTRDGRETDPPELPDERLVSCFTIHVEQLLAPGETEEAIRERVTRLLAAGYDLESVRTAAPFCTGRRHGRRDEEELRVAESALKLAIEKQREMVDEERKLGSLRARKEHAARSRTRAATVTTALDLLALRREIDSLDSDLSEFPEGMAKLVGEESDRLSTLRQAVARHAATLEDVAGEVDRAADELVASGLAESDLTLESLTGYSQLAETLRGVEQERKALEVALEQARAGLDSTVQELGGTRPAVSVRIGPQVVRRLEEELGAKRELEAERLALDEQLALVDPTALDDTTLERARSARVELSRWIAAPEPVSRGASARRLWALLLAAVALAGVATGALIVHWAIAFVGVIVLAAVAMLLRPSASPQDERRREAQRRYSETGVTEPEAWENEPVGVRLAELESEVIAAERSRLDAERRRALISKRDDLSARQAKLVHGLRELANEVGFDPNVLDGSFERWLRLVHAYDEARGRTSELEGNRQALSEREDRLRGDAMEFLRRFGECPDEPSPGAEVLAGRMNHLQERIRQRDGGRRDLEAAKVSRRRAEKEIVATNSEIDALFARAGLVSGDEAELSSRLDRLEQFKQAIDALRETSAVARDTEKRLGAEPAVRTLLEQDDEATLRRELQQAEELAAEYDEIASRILGIENRIENAKAGTDLEQTRAVVVKRREALRDRLDEELFAAAADFVLDDVEREHVAVSRPKVLRRAEEWFARFTSHAFSLNSATARDGQFLARDTSASADRTLDQLSSGTRMQLLLALRLSFALEAEQGRQPLPIFLDEALTVADPDRFASVVECVQEFAREHDRQLFYLTAQPHDLREWAECGAAPNQIRLDEVRRLTMAIPRISELELPTFEQVPTSEGRTAAEYGMILQVPPIRLWDSPDAVHLFHLLRDDLPLLEQLLHQRIRSVGQLGSLLDSDAAARLLTPEQIEDLRFRNSAVPVFLEACRQGRGRPVDRSVLERAGVSEAFLERLTSLLEEREGDGGALLAAIETRGDERVKNFRTKQSAQLRSYFEEHGYVDSRPSLELREIELRVLTSLSTGIETGTISPETITELTHSLAATALPGCARGPDVL